MRTLVYYEVTWVYCLLFVLDYLQPNRAHKCPNHVFQISNALHQKKISNALSTEGALLQRWSKSILTWEKANTNRRIIAYDTYNDPWNIFMVSQFITPLLIPYSVLNSISLKNIAQNNCNTCPYNKVL